jgi:hypothetical protein
MRGAVAAQLLADGVSRAPPDVDRPRREGGVPDCIRDLVGVVADRVDADADASDTAAARQDLSLPRGDLVLR